MRQKLLSPELSEALPTGGNCSAIFQIRSKCIFVDSIDIFSDVLRSRFWQIGSLTLETQLFNQSSLITLYGCVAFHSDFDFGGNLKERKKIEGLTFIKYI